MPRAVTISPTSATETNGAVASMALPAAASAPPPISTAVGRLRDSDTGLRRASAAVAANAAGAAASWGEALKTSVSITAPQLWCAFSTA